MLTAVVTTFSVTAVVVTNQVVAASIGRLGESLSSSQILMSGV